MHYQEQLEHIQRLSLGSGQSKRMTCFACGGAHSLGVSRQGSEMTWHCFRNSCGIKGRTNSSRSVAELKHAFSSTPMSIAKFELPGYLTSVAGNSRCEDYLRKNNVMKAYESGLVRLSYDPKEDRILFLVRDKAGVVVDAIGRSLKGSLPKWKVYGTAKLPFICGTNKTAFLVEDCASASAISHIATGIALLGTSLKASYIDTIKQYNKVVIALDQDASRKALAIQAQLRYFVPCQVALLQEDLKMYDPKTIIEMYEGYVS